MTTNGNSVQPMLLGIVMRCQNQKMNAKSVSVQPELLVNGFLEAFEGNLISDLQMLNSCSGLTKKSKSLDKWGLGCVLARKYAGIARPLLPEGD